jgi:RHS repeat-associated protein
LYYQSSLKSLLVLGFIEITYYPFGMISRSVFTSSLGLGYRYGFNDKENDADVKGDGDQIDYGMRIYDPRLGRFLSVDPLQKRFAFYSTYQYSGNTPIQAIDLDGLEPTGYSPAYKIPFKNLSVRDLPSRYDGQSYDGKIADYKGIINAYAVQDIDRRTYVIFETVNGNRQWAQEYDKNGWKGNLNEFKWNKPAPVGKEIYWLVAPIVVIPVLPIAIEAGAAAYIGVGTKVYPYLPQIGIWGTAGAAIIDPTGQTGQGMGAAEGEVEQKLLSESTTIEKTVSHHIFNAFRGTAATKYRNFFKNLGIEVDKHTVKIPESLHKFLHRAGNNWTTQWKNWIDANPNATAKDVFQQAGKMMDETGINKLPISTHK